jgi:orotate phosphoribosyltransferase
MDDITIKQKFVTFLLDSKVLRFGDFVTKSGRNTPYFINTGDFKEGVQIAQLASFYAHTLMEEFPTATNLYGPAYKGIPLAVATSMALSIEFNRNMSYTFNRKEEKDHGEGGFLVGKGYDVDEEVVIIEDVITAGTSVRETFAAMRHYEKAHIKGLVISVDRMERVDSGKSAIQEVADIYGIKVVPIITINDIIEFIEDEGNRERYAVAEGMVEKMYEYRATYGIE